MLEDSMIINWQFQMTVLENANTSTLFPMYIFVFTPIISLPELLLSQRAGAGSTSLSL
jgi:hypothetical protein